MYLDWDQRITDLCNKLDFVPELYNEDDDLMEWVAKHFGFKDYDTFQALASPKDIISGMALPMLPDHKNFEFYLTEDCIELIQHNYDLYNDEKRTRAEIEFFLHFASDCFSAEMIIFALKRLLVNTENVIKFLPSVSVYTSLANRYGHLTAEG